MTDLLAYLVVASLIVVPFFRILGRAGFSPWLALLTVIPWLGLVIVASILSFAQWPAPKNKSEGN